MTAPATLELPFIIDSKMSKEDMARAIQRNLEHLAGTARGAAQTIAQVLAGVSAGAAATETLSLSKADQLNPLIETLTVQQGDPTSDAVTIQSAGGGFLGNLLHAIGALGALTIDQNASIHMFLTDIFLTDNIGVPAKLLLSNAGYEEFSRITEPAAPAAAKVRLYVKDNGAGKSQLCVRWPAGTVTVLATEP